MQGVVGFSCESFRVVIAKNTAEISNPWVKKYYGRQTHILTVKKAKWSACSALPQALHSPFCMQFLLHNTSHDNAVWWFDILEGL